MLSKLGIILRSPGGDSIHQCPVENFKLNPWWVTGFLDDEGCFYVFVRKKKNYKLGWQVEPRFTIALHKKDQSILKQILKFFGVGRIYKQGAEALQLKVENLKGLEIILNHFDKFPLKTKKRSDFKLLKMVIIKIKRKEHLTLLGLQAILAIRA